MSRPGLNLRPATHYGANDHNKAEYILHNKLTSNRFLSSIKYIEN